MAKKNLASLMSGIMGDAPVEKSDSKVTEDTSTDSKQAEGKTMDEAQPVTKEMEDSLAAKRRRNVGRPRKDETREKTEEVRATFIVDPGLVRKMKYISLVEGNLLKDVIGEALRQYIDSWESENGIIRLPKKK